MTTETITWHAVAPDTPLIMGNPLLLWVIYSDGLSEWCAGWRDSGVWRYCVDSMPIDGTVTHWADPQGPQESSS